VDGNGDVTVRQNAMPTISLLESEAHER
jgi:hypothetical protein